MKTEDASIETWMNIDEYTDQESYEEFTKIFQKSNPDYAELFKIEEELVSLLVPNSLTREVYVEKPELRIVWRASLLSYRFCGKVIAEPNR